MTIILVAVAVVLLLTWIGGRHLKLFDAEQVGWLNSMIATAIGLLAVSPALTVAAYEVLRDDEFEPYRGRALYLRSGACGLAYTSLWAVFSLLASRGIITGDVWNWFFVVPPFVVIGALAATGAFDLEFGDGIFHYSFYLLATLLLRWAAGMKWIWDMG